MSSDQDSGNGPGASDEETSSTWWHCISGHSDIQQESKMASVIKDFHDYVSTTVLTTHSHQY